MGKRPEPHITGHSIAKVLTRAIANDWYEMNTRRTNRSGGESSEPPGSGSRVATAVSVPLNEATTNQEGGVEELECEWCIDYRAFTTQIGLSQHIRQAHPVEYNRGINVDKTRARWTDEESNLMAKEEAKATRDGAPSVNQRLTKIFTNRTLDGIKGQRKKAEYKQRVQGYIDELIALEREEEEDVVQWFDASEVPIDTNDELLNCISNLVDKLSVEASPYTQRLVGLAQRVLEGTPLESGSLARWLKSLFKNAKPPNGVRACK